MFQTATMIQASMPNDLIPTTDFVVSLLHNRMNPDMIPFQYNTLMSCLAQHYPQIETVNKDFEPCFKKQDLESIEKILLGAYFSGGLEIGPVGPVK